MKQVCKSQFVRLMAVSAVIFFAGCVPPPPQSLESKSNLTQGNVQLNLQVGETNKAEVLEKFGAPNITTRDGSGREVWTYQRAAQVSQSSSRSGGWSVILGGAGSGAAGGLGGGLSGTSSGFESSSRMITLIIKFDSNDIVVDFNSRSSNF